MPKRPLRVLVVEDEPANREIAQVILELEGHDVTCVTNGKEAIDLCIDEGSRFDLIVMDILMPVMTGIEATRRLKAHPDWQGVPIVCVSAKASGSDEQMGRAAGCDLYLTKPYDRKGMLKAVDDAMGWGQEFRAAEG